VYLESSYDACVLSADSFVCWCILSEQCTAVLCRAVLYRAALAGCIQAVVVCCREKKLNLARRVFDRLCTSDGDDDKVLTVTDTAGIVCLSVCLSVCY